MNEPMRKMPTTGPGGRKALALFSAVALVGLALYASHPSLSPAPANDPKEKGPTTQAVAAANKFLDALDATQRKKVLYEFASDRKSRWSNFPVIHVPRNGVALGDLSKEQRILALEVVAAVTSKGGYRKVVDIMDGDQQLAEGKGGGGRRGPAPRGRLFGADKYYLALFGKPSETQPWMVQFPRGRSGPGVVLRFRDRHRSL